MEIPLLDWLVWGLALTLWLLLALAATAFSWKYIGFKFWFAFTLASVLWTIRSERSVLEVLLWSFTGLVLISAGYYLVCTHWEELANRYPRSQPLVNCVLQLIHALQLWYHNWFTDKNNLSVLPVGRSPKPRPKAGPPQQGQQLN